MVVNGYTNHYWNGVTCYTLSNIIKRIIDEDLFWKGVRHVHSPDTVTKYDLCCYVNKIYGLNINIVPVESEIKKNMTLHDPCILFEIPNVYDQIVHQKDI